MQNYYDKVFRGFISIISQETIIFLCLITFQIFPLIYFDYFPNWDGPAHVGSAAIIANYNNPSIYRFHEYFKINWKPSPNLLGHIIMVLFLKIFSPIWTEKILVMIIVILLPISIRYCFAMINSNSKYLSHLSVPLAINWFVHAGFYNFSLSLSLFFIALGYWIKHRENLERLKLFVFSMLLLLIYLSHIVSYLIILFFIFSVIAFDKLTQLDMRDNILTNFSNFYFMSIYDIRRFLIACTPSLVLVVFYFLNTESEIRFPASMMYELIKNLLTLGSVMLVFNRSEYFFSILLSLTILSLVGYSLFIHLKNKRKWGQEHEAYLLISIILTILYFVVPDALAGGSFLSPRLIIYVFFALLLWLANIKIKLFVQRIVIVLAVFISVGMTCMRIPYYIDFNKYMAEYMSVGPLLKKNSTILPLFYVYDGVHGIDENQEEFYTYSLRTRPIDHIAGYLMAKYEVVDLAHYESAYDYFLIQFRSEVDPFTFIGTGSRWTEYIPAEINFLKYQQQTSGTVDYVLVWGMDIASERILLDPATISVQGQLMANYELIFISKPRGLLHLYKRLDDLKD